MRPEADTRKQWSLSGDSSCGQGQGGGSLGTDFFRRLINHPLLRDLPFYLETPNELDGYAREIALLKELYEE